MLETVSLYISLAVLEVAVSSASKVLGLKVCCHYGLTQS